MTMGGGKAPASLGTIANCHNSVSGWQWAGMGGSVGLKGTDGEMYKKALELGAEPVTPKRTKDLLARIQYRDDMILLAAPGKMGEQYVKALGAPFTVVPSWEFRHRRQDPAE